MTDWQDRPCACTKRSHQKLTHHSTLVDGDVRGYEVNVTLSPVDDGRVCLSGTEARFTARDEASQSADAETLAEVGGDLRDERAADLIAAYADQRDAVSGVESSFLCCSAETCPRTIEVRGERYATGWDSTTNVQYKQSTVAPNEPGCMSACRSPSLAHHRKHTRMIVS